MSGSYRFALVNSAIWLLLGTLQISIEFGYGTITDVSMWETSTWAGVGFILFGLWWLSVGVRRFRSRTQIVDEGVQASKERFETWGGEYILTDDTVYADFSEVTGLRRFHKQKPLVAGFTLFFFGVMLLGGIGMAASGLVVQILPFRLFLPLMYMFLGSALLVAGIPAGFAFWRFFSLKRHLGTELGTRKFSNEYAISRDAIDSVVFDRHMNLPVMYVIHQQSNGTAVQVAYFLRDAAEEVENAQSTFRSLGVPVRQIAEPNPASSAG